MPNPISGTSVLLLAATATANQTNESLGAGPATAFNHTLAHGPVQPGSFTVTATGVAGADDGNGNIIGTGVAAGSTIDYQTLAVVLNTSASVSNPEANYTSITFTVVGSQTNAKFGEKTATIDTTSKSSRNATYIPGKYSSTVSLDHLYVPLDAGYEALKTAIRTGATIMVQRQESGGALEQAMAVVTGMDGDFKDKAAGTISVTLEVTGPWTT